MYLYVFAGVISLSGGRKIQFHVEFNENNILFYPIICIKFKYYNNCDTMVLLIYCDTMVLMIDREYI